MLHGRCTRTFSSLSFQSGPPKKKPAASGGGAKASGGGKGKGKGKGATGMDAPPDQPEPAIAVRRHFAVWCASVYLW